MKALEANGVDTAEERFCGLNPARMKISLYKYANVLILITSSFYKIF